LWGSGILFGISCFIKPIVEEFGWTYLAVSLAGSLFSVELGVLAPVAGFLADRFGPRRIIFISGLLSGVGFILLSRINSLAMFYLAFIILSVGLTGYSQVVTITAVAQWFNKKIGRATGFAIAGYGAGGILMPLIVWLIANYGWQNSLAILGFATCLVVLPTSILLRHKPEQYGYLPDGESSNLVNGEQNEMKAVYPTEIKFTPAHALKTGAFWSLGFILAVQYMVFNAVSLHVMPYFASIGWPKELAAKVAMCIPLSSIAGRLSFGWLGDLFSKRFILATCFSLQVVGLVFFYYAHNLWQFIAFLIFFGPSVGGVITLRSAIVRESFGRSSFGTMQGLLTAVMTVGGIIGPAYAGWIFDIRRDYKVAWLTFAGVMLAAIPVILATKKGIVDGRNDIKPLT
jgi:sugar phosphate permease